MTTPIPFIINCPYCDENIEIVSYACRIYIHGYYKTTMKQVGQHLRPITINSLLKNNKVIGCMGQFRINVDNTIDKTSGL